jgi:hypothetical protein
MLQANEKALPLTTEIPYSLDAAFTDQTDAWIESQRSVGDRPIPPSADSSSPKRSGAARFALLAALAAALIGLAGPIPRTLAQQPAAARSEPRRQYNNALSELKLAVMNPRMPEAEAAAAAKKFLADVRALPGGIAFLAEVRRVMDGVQSALTNADASGISPEVLALGPGSTDAYVGVADGRILRFKPAPGRNLPELTFARVDLPGGEIAYIAATECSVGQFAAILSGLGRPTDFRAVLRKFDLVSDPRSGPRTWQWRDPTGDKGPIIPARDWLARRSFSLTDEYTPGQAPPPPTADSPMNYLSPGAALYAAQLVGCRLPAAAEWVAAKTRYADNGPPGSCNLRDRTWRTQFDYVQAANDALHKLQLPDEGMFAPVGVAASPSRDAAADWSDSTLWFTAVGVGSGELVHNLVGNVAEYVFDTPPGDPPEPHPKAIQAFVTAHAARVHVVGGSALSDPAVNPSRPLPVVGAEAEEGYADVGFRLCFSAGLAGDQTLAARINRIIEPLPTLPTR